MNGRGPHAALGPATGYLWRLLERMHKMDLRLREPNLYRLVVTARGAVQALSGELHYQSVGHGVGRPPARRTIVVSLLDLHAVPGVSPSALSR